MLKYRDTTNSAEVENIVDGWNLKRPPMVLEKVFRASSSSATRAGSVMRVASEVGDGAMTISHAHQHLSAP